MDGNPLLEYVQRVAASETNQEKHFRLFSLENKMQAWPGPGPLEMFVVMLLGGSVGMPTGIPPGPEDPLAAKIAPSECLFYLSWAAAGEPDPASKNHTEQLLAEPQIQEFLKRVNGQFAEVMSQRIAANPDLLRSLPKHGGALFLTDVQLRGEQLPDLRGGLLLRLDDQINEVQELIVAQLDRLNVPATTFKIGNRSFYRSQQE